MARNDELMTALADIRGALEKEIDALGERADAARREVTDTVTIQLNAQVSSLQADNREARDRLNSACDALSEITASLPGLRQEVAGLAQAVSELRAVVGELSTRPPAAPQTDPSGDHGPASEQTASANDGDPQEPAVDSPVDSPVDSGAETGNAPAAPSPTRPEAETGSPEEAARRQAASEAFLAHRGSEEAAADAAPAPGTVATTGDDGTDVGRELVQHDVVLGAAATVGTVHLVCHRELWDFIREHAEHVPHFRAPAVPSEEGHDRLRVTLSGRSVIGVLTAMRATRTRSAKYGQADGTWSLSDAVYKRLAHDLTTTDRTGTTPLTVVFDDGVSNDCDHG